jgi:hypothetical protein
MHALIHKAGIYTEPTRGSTPEGHAHHLGSEYAGPFTLTAITPL